MAHLFSIVSFFVDLKVRLAVTTTLRCPALVRPHLDGFEHDGTLSARHNLVSGRSKDLNHDAVMRIGSEAPKRRTHLPIGMKAKGLVGVPPPRTVIGAPSQA